MSTDTLSKLFVRIGADASGFEKAMNKIQSKTATLGKKLTNTGAAMTKGITAPILGATAALYGIAQKTANAGDEIQKMALRTGFSTEALSEFKHAAEISGTSIDSMEKGVKRMQRTLFDAERGLSTATEALGALGLSYEELNGLSPEEQFTKISMSLADVEDASKKSAIAQQIFGRAGTDLLPMLAEGSEGIAALRQEAHDLGIVFDQESADAAAKFNDDLDRLKKSFTGIFQELGNKLIPIFVDDLMPLIQEKLVPAVQNFADKIAGLIKWFADLPGPIQKFILILVGLLAAAGPVLVIAGQLITAISAIMPLIYTLGGFISGLALGPIAIIAGAVAGLYLVWKNWDKIVDYVKGFAAMIKDILSPLTEGIVNAFTGMKDAVIGVFEFMWNGIKKIINWIIGGINKLIDGLNKFSIKVPDWVPGNMKSFGFNIKRIPQLAEGGSANLSGSALVGEEGPELLTLPRGATVSPLAAGAGGGDFNFNISELTVRKESDIDKIALKLNYLQKKKDRRIGP